MKIDKQINLNSFPNPALCHALKRGERAWWLRFEGQEAVLTHSLGLLYIARLLARPNAEPLHAVALARLAPGTGSAPVALEINSVGDRPALVGRDAYLVQHNLGDDEVERLRRLRLRLKVCEAVADDPDENPAIRLEAGAEAHDLQREIDRGIPVLRTQTKRTVRSVQRAITRAILGLYEAAETLDDAVPVLRNFADHLDRHLLVPSNRFASARARRVRAELSGCYRYEPPPGVVWDVS